MRASGNLTHSLDSCSKIHVHILKFSKYKAMPEENHLLDSKHINNYRHLGIIIYREIEY